MEVEWLILADAAQLVGNKLYLMGGGWDVLTGNTSFPIQQQCAIAVSVRAPRNETNQRHSLDVEILTDDGKSIGKIEGQFEIGRPPGIRPGQDQRMQMAAGLGLKLDNPGVYAIVARIDGQEGRRVHFNVVPGPGVKPK